MNKAWYKSVSVTRRTFEQSSVTLSSLGTLLCLLSNFLGIEAETGITNWFFCNTLSVRSTFDLCFSIFLFTERSSHKQNSSSNYNYSQQK